MRTPAYVTLPDDGLSMQDQSAARGAAEVRHRLRRKNRPARSSADTGWPPPGWGRPRCRGAPPPAAAPTRWERRRRPSCWRPPSAARRPETMLASLRAAMVTSACASCDFSVSTAVSLAAAPVVPETNDEESSGSLLTSCLTSGDVSSKSAASWLPAASSRGEAYAGGGASGVASTCCGTFLSAGQRRNGPAGWGHLRRWRGTGERA